MTDSSTFSPAGKMPVNVASGLTAILALCFYWATVDPGVSYWDCPEYVVCGSRLEIGHPPGNPVWMLVMRMATLPFPLDLHSRVINMMSGFFMALAGFFLCRIAYRFLLFVARKSLSATGPLIKSRYFHAIVALCSAGGTLCFSFCDSAWFSAVEAEVYAMSAFLTALSVWLMCRWAEAPSGPARSRWLILCAYVMGLSLGVHQLNLLVIPALALIFIFCRHPGPGQTLRAWIVVLFSVIGIGFILIGLMHGSLSVAAQCELLAVNTLKMPLFSGVLLWVALTVSVSVLSACMAPGCTRPVRCILTALPLWLTGLTVMDGRILLGLILAIILAIISVYGLRIRPLALATSLWMLTMIFFGYGAYALILIRGAAAPPMNESTPTDIFAFQRYIGRKQYATHPLIYGSTPYSRPMLEESFDSVGNPHYDRYVLVNKGPRLKRSLPAARLSNRSGMMSYSDSLFNRKALENPGKSYVIADYDFEQKMTPELNMWFPRITGNEPSHREAFRDWVGMDTSTMIKTVVSETYDSLGNPAGLLDSEGRRRQTTSWRPTYAQNLRMLAFYQIGYMYFRYLLWNFIGRQNDMPASGEIDHGNFITGFSSVDNLMVGDASLMPPSASRDNPGRNVYWGIPFIFGIIGVAWLLGCGRCGKRMMAITGVLFLMTGIAIVAYLNQSPGEPRERDYSFLGSFMVFSTWIAFGFLATAELIWKKIQARTLRIGLTLIPALAVPALMLAENFDDHDRSGRNETLEFALDILNSCPPGIIFTQGDNFTFPLWHAVEMNAADRDWQVIDISYLSTPDYVVNLMKQGRERLPFIAEPSQIAFGRFDFTRVSADTNSDTVPLSTALRELYAKDSQRPVIPYRFVTLAENDTTVIDLYKMSPSGSLPFRQLMLLDILAANNNRRQPADIHFIYSLPPTFYAPLNRTLERTAFTLLYRADADSAYVDSLCGWQADKLLEKASAGKSLPAYIDPVLAAHHRRNRMAYLELARRYAQSGDTITARQLLIAATTRHPFDHIQPGFVRMAGELHDEGTEFARILDEIGEVSGDTVLKSQADDLLKSMHEEAIRWNRYYQTLPASRRNSVSVDTRLIISKHGKSD